MNGKENRSIISNNPISGSEVPSDWKPKKEDFDRQLFPTFNNRKTKISSDPPLANLIQPNHPSVHTYTDQKDSVNQVDPHSDSLEQLRNENRAIKQSMLNLQLEMRDRLSGIGTEFDRETAQRLSSLESQVNSLGSILQRERVASLEESARLRAGLQDRVEQDKVRVQKEGEKGKALFNEMVRLGEQHEKMETNLKQLEASLDSKLLSVDHKMMAFEKVSADVKVIGGSLRTEFKKMGELAVSRLDRLEKDLILLGVFLKEENNVS